MTDPEIRALALGAATATTYPMETDRDLMIRADQFAAYIRNGPDSIPPEKERACS